MACFSLPSLSNCKYATPEAKKWNENLGNKAFWCGNDLRLGTKVGPRIWALPHECIYQYNKKHVSISGGYRFTMRMELIYECMFMYVATSTELTLEGAATNLSVVAFVAAGLGFLMKREAICTATEGSSWSVAILGLWVFGWLLSLGWLGAGLGEHSCCLPLFSGLFKAQWLVLFLPPSPFSRCVGLLCF